MPRGAENWRGPQMSPEQFQEHLDAFQEHLGITFEPNAVVLPTGRRIHTIHQSLDLYPHDVRRPGRDLYADVAAESGRVHSLRARLRAEGAVMDFSMGAAHLDRPGTTHQSYAVKTGEKRIVSTAEFSPQGSNPEFQDPELFFANVQHGLRTSPQPEPWALAHNRQWLHQQAETSGIMHVSEAVEKVQSRGSRLYHFHVASGRLEQVGATGDARYD